MAQLIDKVAVKSGKYVEIIRFSRPFAIDRETKRENFARDFDNDRSYYAIQRAKEALRRLVTANEEKDVLFVTLTYAHNQNDVAVGARDFRNFISRLRRARGEQFRYVACIEFQKRGAVHYHVAFWGLRISSDTERRSRIISNLWKQGFVDAAHTKTRRARDIKRLGWYMSKYLTKGLLDERLRGKKFYFTSRNIRRPEVYKQPENVDRIVGETATMECIKSINKVTPSGGLVKYEEFACND